jgi:hypothetical protein
VKGKPQQTISDGPRGLLDLIRRGERYEGYMRRICRSKAWHAHLGWLVNSEEGRNLLRAEGIMQPPTEDYPDGFIREAELDRLGEFALETLIDRMVG